MKIKDEIAACRMTVLLWEEIVKCIQDNVVDDIKNNIKYNACLYLFGELQHSCPCCEYAKQVSSDAANNSYCTGTNCHKCPMKEFWSTVDSTPKNPGYRCENEDSVYEKWNDYQDENSAIGVTSLAKQALEYWTAMRNMNIIY